MEISFIICISKTLTDSYGIKQKINIKNVFVNIVYSLSDCNWTLTHNHLVHKRTLNHLAKLAK